MTKRPHTWAMSWPGNYCTLCGLDDPTEAAICYPACYIPCCEEDTAKNPVPYLCPVHQALMDQPCVEVAV